MTKQPPNPPPTSAPRDDNWEDEALGDKRAPEMTADAARKLLEINPSMRTQGVDTNFIVNRSAQVKQGAINKAPPARSEITFASAKDADHLLELTESQYAQEKRELESEISILQAKMNGMKSRYCNAMMGALAQIDRNLSSPITQAALQQRKRIVAELGFTPQKFIEYLRQKR